MLIQQAFLQVKMDVTGDQLMSHFFVQTNKLRLQLESNIQNAQWMSHLQWQLGDITINNNDIQQYEFAQAGD